MYFVKILPLSTQLGNINLLVNDLLIFAYKRGTPQQPTMNNRLESYEWTDTGIKFTILDIDEEMDVGSYVASVKLGQYTEQEMIEIKEIVGQCFISLNHLQNCTNVMYLLIIHFICFII